MKKRIVYITITTLILAGAFVFLPATLSCLGGDDPEPPGDGINMGNKSLLEHISRLETTSANKSAQIKELNDEVYALELGAINLSLENESLRSHIKSLPGEAGYKSITQAWNACQAELQKALPYKERLTALTEIWDEEKVNLTDRLKNLMLALEKVNDRTDLTTTTNLTAEKRANFYELWDIWYDTLD